MAEPEPKRRRCDSNTAADEPGTSSTSEDLLMEDAQVTPADKDHAPFRLMDLNLDCRREVYKAMLKFNESFKCHAQVLATCKQINEEATEYLYGINNTFFVEASPAGVFVNGKQTIVRTTDIPATTVRPSTTNHFEHDVYPEYLRKCEHLRFAIGPYCLANLEIKNILELPRYLRAESKFRSLCNFLGQRHTLRSLTVDLRYLTIKEDSVVWRPSMADLYSIRLMQGRASKVSIVGVVDPPLGNNSARVPPLTPNQAPEEAADGLGTAVRRFYDNIDSDRATRPELFFCAIRLAFMCRLLDARRVAGKGDSSTSLALVTPTFVTLLTEYVCCMNDKQGPNIDFSCELRPQAYDILRAIVDLQCACRAAKVETKTYIPLAHDGLLGWRPRSDPERIWKVMLTYR